MLLNSLMKNMDFQTLIDIVEGTIDSKKQYEVFTVRDALSEEACKSLDKEMIMKLDAAFYSVVFPIHKEKGILRLFCKSNNNVHVYMKITDKGEL